jgi:hypothetical protein
MPPSALDRHRAARHRRRSPLAVVGIGLALVLLLGAAVRLRWAQRTAILPLDALVVVRGPIRVTPPVALLYIDRACPHCRPAVARFDSLARAAHIPAFIVAGDARDSAIALVRYADATGAQSTGLALDTAQTLAHAAALKAVPVLVMVDRLGLGTVTYGTPLRLTRTRDSP